MNDRIHSMQLTLFESASPDWHALTPAAQQSVLAALARMLLDALEPQHNNRIATTTTSENNNVS
jgi:hypothetical protein